MKIPKLKLNQLYEIVWIDNNVPARSGWMDRQEIKDYIKPSMGDLVRSSGSLYEQDKDFLVLHSCEALGNYKTWMRIVKILTPCIVYIGECKTKKIFEVKK